MLIIAIDKRETPRFPYLINGNMVQRMSPWTQSRLIKLDALNGSTSKQNKKSATHKLYKRDKDVPL